MSSIDPETAPEAGSTTAGPLSGIKVLELGDDLPSAYAAMILGDLGADVVKVERSQVGRTTPRLGTLGHDRVAFHRNKRSVLLDFEPATCTAVLERAVRWADVVVHSLLPEQTVASLSHDAMHTVNPAAVLCRVSPFGPTGTHAGLPGGDLVMQALSGCMDLTGEAGDPPTRAGVPVTDIFAATYAVIGILAAVYATGEDERGRTVDVAALDVAVALLSNMSGAYFATGEYRSRLGTGHISIFPYNSFPTIDGEVVIAIFTQSFWGKFCSAIGHLELLDDERYATIAARMERKEELTERLNEIFVERTTVDWCEVLEAADVPYAPVASVGQALRHPQTMARDMTPPIVEPEPVGSTTLTVGSPLTYRYADGARFEPPMHLAPEPGRDTEAFLQDLGGTLDTVTGAVVGQQRWTESVSGGVNV